MPNYRYVCNQCKAEKIVNLPIASNPDEGLLCDSCSILSMERRIHVGEKPVVFKDTLGRWYKRMTGKELLGPD